MGITSVGVFLFPSLCKVLDMYLGRQAQRALKAPAFKRGNVQLRDSLSEVLVTGNISVKASFDGSLRGKR